MKKRDTVTAHEGGNLHRFPLLPLRDIVVFPGMMVPLFVGREKSILALEAAANGDKLIFLSAQRDAKTEDPKPEDVYPAGTVSHIVQLLKLPDGTVKVLVEGKRRGAIVSFLSREEYSLVEVRDILVSSTVTPQLTALMRGLLTAFESYAKLTKNISAEVQTSISGMSEPSALADGIVAHLSLKIADKQELLALADPAPRLEKLLGLLEAEIEILEIEKKIRARVKKQMEKTHKEYYLNEQMRAIQKELGGKDEFRQEIADLEEKVAQLPLSQEARQKAQGELKKLKLMSPMSAEAAVVRNYVDWLVSLPWGKTTVENHDLAAAERVLDEDHYGLDKVKERILEYLAVNTLTRAIRGPILCLVGPPGVGKTSLAKSIARATGRNFVKMSLGGMRDEAEIRGHRRTYVGAMPGKIMQSLKKAGSGNPVFLLDEIDKLSADFRGDPAAALLEVLDPEQNAVFADLFLDVDYDLSRVMFVTTANTLHGIPRPLLDRLEVIRLEGYIEPEKLAIARRHLWPRQLTFHGLDAQQVSITDTAIRDVIRHYTQESGVRNLERELATLCRRVARRTLQGRKKRYALQPRHIGELLGVRKFTFGVAEHQDRMGVVTGLAWTENGGALLSVETVVLPGTGKLTITGKLGDVMQESVQAAVSYVRSRAQILGLDRDFYQKADIHLHVPEGAIPKDGPSAGITIATAIVSALTRNPVRHDLAMTGEITLQGRVLPIGGLKEKLLAAQRGRYRKVLLPKGNEKDLVEVPREVCSGIVLVLVEHMDEVLAHALTQRLPGPEPATLSPPLEEISNQPLTAH